MELDLALRLAEAKKKVVVGGRYVHYKQKYYTVLHIALREEDCESVVVYQAEYGDKLVWTRLLSSWLERVVVDSKTVSRFTYLQNTEVEEVL